MLAQPLIFLRVLVPSLKTLETFLVHHGGTSPILDVDAEILRRLRIVLICRILLWRISRNTHLNPIRRGTSTPFTTQREVTLPLLSSYKRVLRRVRLKESLKVLIRRQRSGGNLSSR